MDKEQAIKQDETKITCEEYLEILGLNKKVIYDTPYGLKYPITKDFIEYVKVLQEENRNNLTKALKTFSDSEWVDVRDRLPSDDEIAENYGEFEITYFDTILKHQVTIAEFCKNNKYTIVEKDERGHWYDCEDDEIIDVIAWRPLPKPYERTEE